MDGLQPYGIPKSEVTVNRVCLASGSDGEWLSTRMELGRHTRAVLHPPQSPFAEPDAVASGAQDLCACTCADGEGCMLWKRDQPWVGRGASGRGTVAILKYKPTMLIAATVLFRATPVTPLVARR